jgi:hypothetical protein
MSDRGALLAAIFGVIILALAAVVESGGDWAGANSLSSHEMILAQYNPCPGGVCPCPGGVRCR